MTDKPKKTRILSLSIIEKAIEAIEDTPMEDQELLQIAKRYNLLDVYDYYYETVSELNYLFAKRKTDFQKINDLYLTRERLYRILNPTIYLNAYKEKRVNDALYVNANVGFIDENGKVKNVVVFMGKSEETNLEKLKENIESNYEFIEEAKRKVIEKLVSKITIPKIDSAVNETRRRYKFDAKPEFNVITEKVVEQMHVFLKKVEESKENLPEDQKKSESEAIRLIGGFINSLKQKE